MPKGKGFNSYSKANYFKFQTLDDALQLLKPNFYMGKVALKSAYRSVPIHPSNYAGTGLKWKFKGNKMKFTYFVDTKLPFGGRRSPEIFNRLTQAVRHIMARKGFNSMVVYLDDFLIIGETKEACQAAYEALLSLLHNLGFRINWKKVVYPTQRLVFLGVLLDTVQCSMSLPEDKLEALRSYLLEFSLRCRASKRQLQALTGKLNWACRVVYWGRTFVRRILDQINQLNSPNAKFKFNQEFCADLSWSISFLSAFNGTYGAGALFRGDWFYHSFVMDSPSLRNLHINYKQVLAIIFAAKRWRNHHVNHHQWRNHHVIIQSDNTTAVSIINKGTSKNPIIMGFLRELFWLSAIFNFRITAMHIPGISNPIADSISRLHDPIYLIKACKFLMPYYRNSIAYLLNCPLLLHMSVNSCSFLFF